MNEAMSKSRDDVSEHAPRIISIKINTDKIRDVIGPGGKIIKKLIEDTGCQIDVEQDGTVNIASISKEKGDLALAKVREITAEPEMGQIYQGVIRKIMPFGAFCEILPGTDGLIHVSEIADGFVKQIDEYLKEGDVVKVKVIGMERGRVSLSMKAAAKELGTQEETPAPPAE